MISVSKALKIIKHETAALAIESVELETSIGRVLAEKITADMNLPPFDRSQMDGFAVRSEDVKSFPARLKIIGESIAGKGFDGKLTSGETVRIMTGARVPKGADAVQKVEATREENDFVEILESVKPQQNINLFASEIKRGARVFGAGEIVNEEMIAALASFGYAQVKVFRRPRVSIFSTGSEIVDIGETPQKDQIRNSNSIMLKVLAEKAGADARILPLVRDDYETIKQTIAEAGKNSRFQIPDSKFADQTTQTENRESEIWNLESGILIITGGVSVGDYDFTKPALKELGAQIFFEKVSLKPGKPTVFARLGETLVFGLPGNPVSSAVTFYLFVRAAILRLQGAKNCALEKSFAVCTGKIKGAKERDSFLPVSISTNEKAIAQIEALRFSGSSNFIEFARADALLFVPRGVNFEAGDTAEIFYL